MRAVNIRALLICTFIREIRRSSAVRLTLFEGDIPGDFISATQSKNSSELEDEDGSSHSRWERSENEYSSTDHDSLTLHGDIDSSSTSIPIKSTHLLSRGKTTEEFLITISIFEVAEDELSSLPFSSNW